MAKKKKPKQARMRDAYWPGPTRLYDPEVECGAVLLCSEHAYALVNAAEKWLDNLTPCIRRDHLIQASNILRATFGMPERVEKEGGD